MKDLKQKVVRGGVAKILSQIAIFALRFGSLVVLARLLNPQDFGLVAMASVVTGVFKIFKDAGLSSSTIQRDTINQDQMSTLFWINFILGLSLALLLILIAPAIVDFYNEPRLFWVTVALAADFLFTGASAQHSALLQRQMRFEVIAYIDIITLVSGILVAIIMAAQGLGYWALVGQAVVTPLTNSICTWATVRWLPGRPKRKTGIRSMLRFGGMITLNWLVVYLAYNFEKILLGRFWGAEALGIYGRAYQLVSIPTENLNSSISGVAFSALSRIQDEPLRQKRYFLKGYSLLLAITLPITAACAIFADEMILIFLGSKWNDAAPIFRLLTPTIIVFAMINPFGWLLYSIGLVERSLKIAFVIAPLVISAYFLGLNYGPKGVATAYSVAMTLWVIPHIAWCIHGTGISGRDILQTVKPPLLSGFVAVSAAFNVQLYFNEIVSAVLEMGTRFHATLQISPSLYPWLRLLFGGSVMLAVYLFMLLYIMDQKKFYLNLLSGLKNRSIPS